MISRDTTPTIPDTNPWDMMTSWECQDTEEYYAINDVCMEILGYTAVFGGCVGS